MTSPFCDRGAPTGRRAAFRQLLPRLVLGSGLAAVGVLFTLDNLGAVDAHRWLHWWPALLLALGIGLVLSSSTPGELVGGALWMLFGGGLLLDRLHLLPVRVLDLWPLMLVGLGVLLVVRALRPRVGGAIGGAASAGGEAGQGRDEGSTLHAFAVMSGVTRKSSSVAFEGGSLTAIMGGVEIDLRGARMVRQRATIDCFAIWGGIDITVPPGWAVHGQVWPLMGGFEDKTTPPAPEDTVGELVVTGWAVMGGVTVKT